MDGEYKYIMILDWHPVLNANGDLLLLTLLLFFQDGGNHRVNKWAIHPLVHIVSNYWIQLLEYICGNFFNTWEKQIFVSSRSH